MSTQTSNTPVVPLPTPEQSPPVAPLPGDENIPVVPLPNPGEGGPVAPLPGDENFPVVPLPNPGEGGPVAPLPGRPTLPGRPAYAAVRFLHAAYSYAPFRIYVQNTRMVRLLNYDAATNYLQIPAGYQTVTITGTNG